MNPETPLGADGPATRVDASAVPTILVVDDCDPFRHVTARALRMFGYCVAEAATESEMWREVAARSPAAVVLDWNLGGGDSRARIEQLLAAGTPVLVLTGDPDRARQAICHGVEVLAKPMHIDDLRKRVGDIIAAPTSD